MELYCTICEVTVRFEQPPCPHGSDPHGPDRHAPEQCAEWCCTGCGDAILLAPAIPLRRDDRQATRRAA